LAVSLDWSNDGTNWGSPDPVDTFPSTATTTRRFKNVTVKGRYVRVVWAITGTTPSFTFEVKAVRIY